MVAGRFAGCVGRRSAGPRCCRRGDAVDGIEEGLIVRTVARARVALTRDRSDGALGTKHPFVIGWGRRCGVV
jgi:hypothetical protein